MMTIERKDCEDYAVEIRHRDVAEIANRIKSVPDAWINEAGNHVTDDCCRYLLPLIQGEAACRYECGLPMHLIL
jgi:6-phosphofructokinase 1